ncbi:MAG: GGDEF domain-containing protein [Xanthobacteraceae bacterium]|nr:GGDEF domain-containing protein [Xanthobacteraceae bacterium]
MKRQPARPPKGSLAPPRRPARLLKPSKSRRGRVQTKTTKPHWRALAIERAAEVARLAAELETSRARIGELEARIDVDPLTETLNRRGFERELKRSLAYVKRYGASAALVFLDLDDFKPVNDRHGHAAGDAMLKAITAALVRNVRASDVVARIGGDEFVVLLWNVRDADAAAKAAALEALVQATPVRFRSSTLAVGASAGMAFLGPRDTPAAVLARADAAMYARKAEKNTSPRKRAKVLLLTR